MTAVVYLVGAGPGDAGLITVRGRDLIESCDCLVHDDLVSPELVALAPAGATVRCMGKRGHRDSWRQEQINEALVELAQSHHCIVRLKGGDPFVFGRGGEEARALAKAGIRWEVVPGVTSGIAVPAGIGIPVTDRACAASVAFITGHRRKGQESDVSGVAGADTIVLYMGMRSLQRSVAQLIEAGRSPDTPAMAVSWGGWPQQRQCIATLATIEDAIAAAALESPAIVVVGEVVAIRDEIRPEETSDGLARP
ncbi:MAG: uroporphyrinogen-III C-methyltransferase [Planctomycetota bacterium]|jgi:uroporphyrin-III C-methyltransferase|nr:uroporphyrinogen-III C-methyltransferase [Planctomycetota bacterium]